MPCQKYQNNNTTIWISLNAMIIAVQYFYESKTNFQLDANRCTSMGLWLNEKAMRYPSMVHLYCFMKAFIVERYKSATSCYPFRFPSHFFCICPNMSHRNNEAAYPLCPRRHIRVCRADISLDLWLSLSVPSVRLCSFYCLSVVCAHRCEGRRVETSMGIRWHFWSLFRILAWQIT